MLQTLVGLVDMAWAYIAVCTLKLVVVQASKWPAAKGEWRVVLDGQMICRGEMGSHQPMAYLLAALIGVLPLLPPSTSSY